MAKLPVAQFLEARLKEFDPKFEVRKGTGFEHLFFKPLQFITQPIIDEANRLDVSQSFRKILLQEDPDAYDEEAVDALASNLFVDRAQGNRSGGTARVYYASAVNREWPANGAVFTGSNGMTYVNPAPFAISINQMGAQIEDGNFYYDLPVIATEFGEDGDLEAEGLVELTNDPDVITVTNKVKFSGGASRETNTKLIERTRRSIGVRDLETGKGFNAILFENFSSFLTELQPIGFGDEELMRDIIFNAHVGGRVDGYFKSSSIQVGSKNFIGLLTDLTRQAGSTANVQLSGVAETYLGNTNFDRSNGKTPIVEEVKPRTAAKFVLGSDPDPVVFPVNLTANQWIKITIDGVARTIRLVGSSTAATTRNEVMANINNAFGYQVAFPAGAQFELRSAIKGKTSLIKVEDPSSGTSALSPVFGVVVPTEARGDGPIPYIEGTHYELNDVTGKIKRIVGDNVVGTPLAPITNGSTVAGSNLFKDTVTSTPFATVNPGDILTIIEDPLNPVDYRILGKPAPDTLLLDKAIAATASNVDYYIYENSIKNNEVVFVQFWFNPLAIDVGPLVKLDDLGAQRGVRPGREEQTITDVAFLKIRQIEIIDPVTEESTGEILPGNSGYGYGTYGSGPYGVGSGSSYYMTVNSPTERFSAFEDSFIVLDPGLIGLSFRVTYEYVPEVLPLHNFVRSENERLLAGDILMKHFLPAYVSGRIEYSVDATDSSIPDNETLTAMVKAYINGLRSGSDLKYSDLYQFIARSTDPFDRYGSFVRPFKLTAEIHNADGSTTVISGTDKLVVPSMVPFPKFTERPLSPRITHWIADEIELVRIN